MSKSPLSVSNQFLTALILFVILSSASLARPSLAQQAVIESDDSITSVADDQQPDEAEKNLEIVTNLVWESMEVIQDQHVDPPLKNQMILDGTGRLLPQHKRKLREEIENIRSQEDLKRFFGKVAKTLHTQTQAANPNNSHAQPADGQDNLVEIANQFLMMVPGSPRLVTTYQSTINRQLSENRYVGIGIALSQVNELTSITVAFRGGPAQKAGVINGDQILEVDGESMVGKSLGEVVMALRGPKDSEVDVVVRQPGKDNRKYKMTRGVVPISSVKGVAEKGETDWDYAIPDQEKVAYLEISDITGSTAAELRTAIRQIERGGFEGLVIDFRNCFQAELHHMLMVADLLIEADQLGTWTNSKGVKSPMKLRPMSQLPDVPLTVIASPAQSNEVKLLIQGLVGLRGAKLVGQTNPASPRIRAKVKLPSGAGTIENIYVGDVELKSNPVAAPRPARNQAGRFRAGAKQIDQLIRQAASESTKK